MRLRSRAAGSAPLALLFASGFAGASDLVSAPISHASGFVAVSCHIVNAHPTKDLIVESFFIDDVNTAIGYGSTTGGPCTGPAPWTIPPGRGCSRDLIVVTACDLPNACYCKVRVKGSAKGVRGRLIGSVSGGSTALSADLE